MKRDQTEEMREQRGEEEECSRKGEERSTGLSKEESIHTCRPPSLGRSAWIHCAREVITPSQQQHHTVPTSNVMSVLQVSKVCTCVCSDVRTCVVM